MKKFLVLILLTFLSIGAQQFVETIDFKGKYETSQITADWKKKNPTRLGFVGGCIYNGKTSAGKLIKVYTASACIETTTKKGIEGVFSCQVGPIKSSLNGGSFNMYEGQCEVTE